MLEKRQKCVRHHIRLQFEAVAKNTWFIRFQFEAVVMIEWQRPKLTSLIQAGPWRIHPTHSVHTVLLYPTQMFVKSGSIKNIKFCLQSLNKVFVFFSKGVISNSQRHAWFTTRPFKHLSRKKFCCELETPL